MDSFDLGVVKRTVNEFHSKKNELPTLKKLRQELQSSIDFKGSESTLAVILKQLGFKWCKTENNRKLLIEKSDIRWKRIEYLRAIANYRRENATIVYLDETYVLSSHCSTKSWSDSSIEGLHVPINKGDRLIIIHAGGEIGFIPNALLTWKASSKSGDYHANMNTDNFLKWVREKLIRNLPPMSVVVVDNAPYHNTCIDKQPNSNTKKRYCRLVGKK